MRRLTFICCLLVLFFPARGQLYTFEKSQDTFYALTGATLLTGTGPWSDTVFTVPIGFQFTFYGRDFDTCFLQQGNLFFPGHPDLEQAPDTTYIFYTTGFNIADVGAGSPTSGSPILYKTEGDPGYRIFTIEYRNTRLKPEMEIPCIMDFQIRLFEHNGTLELKYGEVSYDSQKEIPIYLGIGAIRYTDQDSILVHKQTRLYGMSDVYFINSENPKSPVEILPTEGDVYRFLYDRDIILNNYVDMTLISELGNDGTLYSIGGLRSVSNEFFGADIGHNKNRDYEWAERFILSQEVVLKGIVSQHYGYTNGPDSASYSIYLPDEEKMPGEVFYCRKVAFQDLDLSGNLNVLGITQPIMIKDTFFVAFGIPPYDDPSLDCIGLYYASADPDKAENYAYGRTAARWMDGRWYDVYTSRYIDPLRLSGPFLYHNNDLVHFNLGPLVNFFPGNLDPVEDKIKTSLLPVTIEPRVEVNKLILYPHHPNPARNQVTLSFSVRNSDSAQIEIFDLSGRYMYSNRVFCNAGTTTTHSLDVSKWELGTYICVVRTGGAQIASIMIVQ